MQTSDRGRAALELEEGVVLRAYRDVAGVWTIGAGLTAASGVVKPKSGMVITREQADLMLAEALKRYERDVEVAMCRTEPAIVRPAQHEFDAGVSFHFNTGAIGRASWVAVWRAKAARGVILSAICLWSKAGGKVLPALKARREREGAMLLDGVYRVPAAAPNHPAYARWGQQLSMAETRAVFDGLGALGYDPGDGRDLILVKAVLSFQRDHALTVDGIIGTATLSTLQRALDARIKAQLPIAANVVALGGVVSGVSDTLTGLQHSGSAGAAVAAIWIGVHLWRYRDAVAAAVAPSLPRLADYLRSR